MLGGQSGREIGGVEPGRRANPKPQIRNSQKLMSKATHAINERFVEANGMRIRFWHAGSGPSLVLVHGLLGYSFSWRRVITEFARDREVFALDMPGAGFSECRADLDCRLLGAAQRLLAFLNAAEISSCDLVGSSYGGSTG